MTALLLDASVILAAFDSDDALHGSARAILVGRHRTLATLDLVRYEVANVVIRAWREPDRVDALLEAIDQISSDGGVLPSTTELLTRAAQLAEEHTISVYDAAYAVAARQAGATLVSCDIRDLVSKRLATSPEDVRPSAPVSADPHEAGSDPE